MDILKIACGAWLAASIPVAITLGVAGTLYLAVKVFELVGELGSWVKHFLRKETAK